VGVALLAGAMAGLGQQKPAGNPLRATALQLEQQGRTAEAEKAWSALSKAQPKNPEPWAHLGLLASRQGNYKEAIARYRKALELGPPVEGVRMNLGLAYFKNEQMREAIKEFEPLLKAHPENQQLTILIGMAHYGLAEYAEAAPYLKDAAARDAQSLPLRLALAHSYLWSKQLDKVMEVYKEILTLNPDSAEADMIAGEALDEMKDNEGSTKMFRAAVKANPKEPNAHFGLAYLLWTQKQYPEAAQEFRAELANDPNHEQAMLYLGDTLLQLNQPQDAQPVLEKVVKLAPEMALAHLDLGLIYAEAAKNEDALRELTTAEKLMPKGEVTTEMVTVHWRLGRLYRAMGRKEEAKAEFDLASKLNKQADEDLHNKIANAHARPPQGQAEGAPAEAQPAGSTPQP
jgi:tetratricopeptide (TPR) repeat protein